MSGLLIGGCGGGGGGGNSTPDGDGREARFTVSPSTLDFGKAVIGQTVSGTVVVTNTGSVDLTMSSSNPGDGFSVARGCGTLAPQARCDLMIEFTPSEQKIYSATLNVSSAGLVLSPALRGSGQGLNLEITGVSNSCEDSTFTALLAVTGAAGDPILGLRAENIAAFLNDQPLSLRGDLEVITERQTAAVGLTLDWSSSLDFRRQDIIDGSRVFIDSLGLERDGLTDKAGIFRFSREVDGNAQNFIDADSAGKAILTEALTRDFSGPETGSFIWSATDFVVTQAAAQPNPVRAVVLLSDGRSSDGDLALSQLIENAQDEQIRVFTIGFGSVNPGPLQALAQQTGGLFFSDPQASGLMQIFSSISSVLTNQYEVTYDNASPDSSNELRVVITDDAGLEGEDTVTIASCAA
ncbi:MAG: choice-of-anchor D domain-containing protein [Pseudomonadales bacterium]